MNMNTIIINNRYSCYQIIFQQQYDFIQTARTLEGVLQRINEFLFLLYARNDTITPILLIEAEKRELFNNVMHITLVESSKDTILDLLKNMRIYAKLKLKQHYAIPFTIVPEPFPLYRILADYYFNYNYNYNYDSNDNVNTRSSTHSSTIATATATNNTIILFAIHAKQRSERISVASYLRKHDLARTSTFYAYGEAIRQKLQSTHYHCTLLLACTDSKIALLKALTAFKVQYFAYFLKSNNNRDNIVEKQRLARELFARPKKPISIPYIRNPIRYPVLSSIELVSLMLPDSVKGVRTTVDGIRPYTTGTML